MRSPLVVDARYKITRCKNAQEQTRNQEQPHRGTLPSSIFHLPSSLYHIDKAFRLEHDRSQMLCPTAPIIPQVIFSPGYCLWVL